VENIDNQNIHRDLYKHCIEYEDGIGRELGVQSGRIKASQFSASSYSANRKVNSIYWKPKKFDSFQYLTIDLEKRTLITALSTMGHQSEYVSVYTISYSNDGLKWVYYTDSNNIVKVK
jgi:hypothetical protein